MYAGNNVSVVVTLGCCNEWWPDRSITNPVDLFNKPANIFVADFVWGNNILNLGKRTYSLRTDKLKLVAASTDQKNKGSLFK